MSKKITQNVDHESKESKLFSAFKNVRPDAHLLHLSVLRQLNNKRAGTASTKTKGEVRGGGKKPWRQKGTGRARAGSNRSPLWVGGGIIFGPKPRSYKTALPQKERNLAILQAFISKEEQTITLEKLPELNKIKTKDFLESLKKLNLNQRPLLMICDSGEKHFEEVKKSANNLQDVEIKDHKFVGVHEMLKANKIAITKKSLNELEKRFSKFVSKKNTKVA